MVGDKESRNQEEEYQRQCRLQARLHSHEAALRQQEEELNALIHKLDRVYSDIE